MKNNRYRFKATTGLIGAGVGIGVFLCVNHSVSRNPPLRGTIILFMLYFDFMFVATGLFVSMMASLLYAAHPAIFFLKVDIV